jgi:hypothetical protein
MSLEDRDKIEAYVGRNSAYYATKWATIRDRGAAGSRVSWNWAAAIGGIVWMLYRRLYIPVALIIAVSFVDASITIELEEAGLFPVATTLWDKFSYIVYMSVMGCWGNYWYLSRYQRAVKSAAADLRGTEGQLEFLAEKGGTNFPAAGLVLAVSGALIVMRFLGM